MPRGDRTGPEGRGPATGRGMGGCSPANGTTPGASRNIGGLGLRRGFGGGRGLRRGPSGRKVSGWNRSF